MKTGLKKPTIVEVYNDDDTFSHWSLVDTETGEKLWSENPVECKAQGYPVEADRKNNSDLLKQIDELKIENELLLKEQKIKNIQYNKLDDRFNNYVLTTEKQLVDISDKKAKLQSQLSESNARVKELEEGLINLKILVCSEFDEKPMNDLTEYNIGKSCNIIYNEINNLTNRDMKKLIERHARTTAAAAFGAEQKPSERHANITKEVAIGFKQWYDKSDWITWSDNRIKNLKTDESVNNEQLFDIYLETLK